MTEVPIHELDPFFARPKSEMGIEVWYRYRDNTRFSDFNAEVVLEELEVIRHTPCGVWVQDEFRDRPRFVMNPDKGQERSKGKQRARFAYPSKEEAAKSYLIRKEKAVSYAAQRLDRQELFLALAKELVK